MRETPTTVVYLTLWDPARSDEDLLAAVWEWLARTGARRTPEQDAGASVIRLRAARPFVEPRLETELRIEDGEHAGGQVTLLADEWWLYHEGPVDRQFRPLAERIAGSKRLRTFYAALDRLLDDVRPFVAVWPAEMPVDELPTLDENGSALLKEGWVDFERLTAARRNAVADLVGDARVPTRVGWRWMPVSPQRAQQIGGVLAGRTSG